MVSEQVLSQDYDVEMIDRQAHQSKKGNGKAQSEGRARNVLHQFTLRKPSWTYFRLRLFFATTPEALDLLTVKRYLTSALQRFIGLHGVAIPADILKLDGQRAWIRVPREDASIVHEALSSWTGGSEEGGVRWIVEGKDEWMVRLAMGSGDDLFIP